MNKLNITIIVLLTLFLLILCACEFRNPNSLSKITGQAVSAVNQENDSSQQQGIDLPQFNNETKQSYTEDIKQDNLELMGQTDNLSDSGSSDSGSSDSGSSDSGSSDSGSSDSGSSDGGSSDSGSSDGGSSGSGSSDGGSSDSGSSDGGSSEVNICGNNLIDQNEQCDGVNLNQIDCMSLGFSLGTLACNSNCSFNTTNCTLINKGIEICDNIDNNCNNLIGEGGICESIPVEDDVVLNKNVMIIVYNPIMHSLGDKRLTELFGYHDPIEISQIMKDKLEVASHGIVNFTITETYNVDGFSEFNDGTTFTEEKWLECRNVLDPACYATGDLSSDACKKVLEQCTNREVNYRKILVDFGICEKLNKDEIHEVWLWGAPFFGYGEAAMAGKGAFYINGPIITGTTCEKRVAIMGYNYERNDGLLHPYGHRAEATMTKVFGGWAIDILPRHDWDLFGQNAGQTGEDIAAHTSNDEPYWQCGSAHLPPNGLNHYDYANPNPILSNCNDWYNYPNFNGVVGKVSCEDWGCVDAGNTYLYWWFGHIPHALGKNPATGKFNNWWRYIVDYEEIP